VLQSGPQARAFSPAEAEARLQTLMQGWAVSEADLTATLTAADLTRDNVLARIQSLLTVEDALQQMVQKGIDMAAWLPQARAQSDVGLYQSAPFQPQSAPDAVAAATPTHAASMAAAVTPPPDLPVAPYPDSVAPDFSAETLDGGQMTLSQWRGKPALINFWASWCGPCRSELPALQEAYNRYQGDINFVAVNVREGKGTINSFANKNAITFPIALDPAGEISTGLYQVRGIPTTFFLDSRGVIVKRHVGPLDLQAIDSYLLPLLNPPTDIVAAETQPPPSETPAPDTSTQAANLAPDFELPDAQGTSFKLSDALRDGPVVLVFYRGVTWGICLQQLVGLEADKAKFKAAGVQVVAVAVQKQADAAKTVNQTGATYPVLADDGHRVADQYGIYNLLKDAVAAPSTFVIDRDGRIVWSYIGKDVADRPANQTILQNLP